MESGSYIGLKGKYIPGSQMWFEKGKFPNRDRKLRGFGCGVVACQDFCVYKGIFPEAESREAYKEQIRILARRYFPVMPGAGIAPYFYGILLDCFFRRRKLPYRVRGSFSAGRIDRLIELLKGDQPVILCVGPTLPLLFRKKRIPLLTKSKTGVFLNDGKSVQSHYMTVVGAEKDTKGDWFLRVATWGEFHYMRLSDYISYTRYTFPFTNRFYQIVRR